MSFQLPPVMGHRGALAYAPENTLAGIRKVAELGIGWVEFDVMLTGDDVPVLFHDDNLKRITGKDALMAETPHEALSALEAGAWFGSAFAGEPLPSLEQALELIWELGLRANVEIKPSIGRDVVTAKRTIEVMSALWPADQPIPMISSFSRMSLAAAQALRPEWPRGLVSHRLPKDWREALQALECVSFHLNTRALNRDRVARIKAAGYQVASYTVNRKRRARQLASFGVDCLISDTPDKVVDAMT